MTVTQDTLLARENIKEVIYTYCFGVDREQWDRVRGCFTLDATHDHGTFEGDTDTFIGFAADILKQMDGTMHTIGNVLITFDAGSVKSEATFVAYHRLRGGSEGPLPAPEHDKDWIVAGRYCDDWTLDDGRWKIKHRQAIHDWTRMEDANEKLI
ncbi:MAG: nuclear transport factor 2 family protein [Pseudomonadota bacterium]